MFDWPVLDVLLGLALVYLLLALMCTTVNEWFATIFKRRSVTLETAIRGLLDGPGSKNGLADKFYAHPLIRSLAEKGKKPSYIPPETFATVVLSLLSGPGGAGTKSQVLQSFDQEPNPPLQGVLQAIFQGADTPDSLKARLEDWYNNAMDRVSGWYKRDTQVYVVCLALLVTVLTNADTMQIAQSLWTNPTLRAAMVEQAKTRAATPLSVEYTNPESAEPSPPVVFPPDGGADPAKLTQKETDLLGQLLSWVKEFQRFHGMLAESKVCDKCKPCLKTDETAKSEFCPEKSETPPSGTEARNKEQVPCDCDALRKTVDIAKQDGSFPGWEFFKSWGVLCTWFVGLLSAHLLGWILTAIAVSLGAPFWFDVLNKITKMRSAGKVPETKTRKTSEATT